MQFLGVADKQIIQLQLIQNATAKLVTGKYKYDHLEDDLHDLYWLPIKQRIVFKIALLAFKSVNGYSPPYIQDIYVKYCHRGTSLN